MQAVFGQAVTECQKGNQLLEILGRELYTLPSDLLREHWFALTHQEIVMEAKITPPERKFYLFWIALTTLAIPLALVGTIMIVVLATNWMGDWITVNGQKHITEDYLVSYVLPPMLWLATSILQSLLLRRHLPRMGWWILATGLGWGLLFTLNFLINSILNLDFFWNSNSHFIVTLTGVSIGFSQWALLRRRIPRAGWWILASVLGFALIAPFVGLPFTNFFEIYAIGFLPGIATAICWWFLFQHPPSTETDEISGDSIKI